ncbi:MAG: hypothetical protein NTV66_05675 [Methylococcales bacterium]|nr:hypothetical protein [Methylococcales bacterium]
MKNKIIVATGLFTLALLAGCEKPAEEAKAPEAAPSATAAPAEVAAPVAVEAPVAAPAAEPASK